MKYHQVILLLSLLSACTISNASNSSFTCELSSQIKSKLFESDFYSTFTAPYIGWFLYVQNNIVTLQNTGKNITHAFNVTEVMNNSTIKFNAYQAIYMKERDILIIAGNGAYAVYNATKSISSRSNYIIHPISPSLSAFSLVQYTEDSFALGYVDFFRYQATGYLYTYNVTTWTGSRISLDYFPQKFIALSSQQLVYRYYSGYNEQLLSLPNLTVIQNISLPNNINPYIFTMVPNNKTSYFVSNTDGIFLYYYNSSTPLFNFGKEQNITDVDTLNHKNSFVTFENLTQVNGYHFSKGPGGYLFDQIGSINVQGKQGEPPVQFAFTSGVFDQSTNTYQSQFVAGFRDYYRVYECTYLSDSVTLFENKSLIEEKLNLLKNNRLF